MQDFLDATIFPLKVVPPIPHEAQGEDFCVEKKPGKINLLDLDRTGLKDFFVTLGEKPFRSQQVLKWIHRYGIDQFSEMTDLSKSLREQLSDLCKIEAPEIAKEQCSKDGTRKWLMRLCDGNQIETVFIPEKDRGTLCVSSQVGCALNCRFCSTATQGFNRNLTVGEIIGQLWQVVRRLKAITKESLQKFEVTNVVMMGMGEPLLNFDAVLKALAIMRDDLAYALPRRRVTVSTSGVVPNIYELSQLADVSLAISLHAPNDELRNRLVPLNKKYPIVLLMEACRQYAFDKPNRHVTIEYVMLKGINDSLQHAKQLIHILQGIPCKVNLIPFNPFPGTEYERSSQEMIEAFQHLLMKAGFIATTRKTRGEDIDAACGQLVGRIKDRTRRNARFIAKTLSHQTELVAVAEGGKG